MPEIHERKIKASAVLTLLSSLALCDHIGDLADDVYEFAKLLGIDTSEADDLSEVGMMIREKLIKDGVTSVFALKPEDIYAE